ncbi:hypothetical protein Swol_0350 [Syntrophomonas wolfei subsp. wolfei str. Goettingen G311]|uniref:Uncharacterized protein n=2 Tax=Syntrophomonas wolfei TaxID=863 RepID=Q0B013_SYNWW|nr:hypothetical protein Swol_0350 [Syntrophomonas wolfei subsp. wolfei str. Goettingen G311]
MMSKVEAYETPIMSLEEFNVGLLEKDRIPGLLIRSDEQGFYNIGVQINDREVVKVASAMEDDAMYKIQFWADKVDQIKDQYKERQPQLK